MDPRRYQELAKVTETDQEKSLDKITTEGVSAVRLLHAAVGLAGDAGEVCAAVERYIYYKQELDRMNLVEELGDCLWYIALACNALEIDMGNVMATNISKLRARYPDAFDREQSKEENRNRAAESAAMAAEMGKREETPEVMEACKYQMCPWCREPISDEVVKQIYLGTRHRGGCPGCRGLFSVDARRTTDGQLKLNLYEFEEE